MAIAAIHTKTITDGKPVATDRQGAPNITRRKKYAPPAYTEPSTIAVVSGWTVVEAHSVAVRPG